MNLDNIRKGVAALRSGEYKQARGALRVNDRYCCLGVLCDVYRKETGIEEWVKIPTQHMAGTAYQFLDIVGVLPVEVMKWLGWSETNPTVSHPILGSKHTLAHLNDGHKLSFSEIADVIEQNFLQVPSDSTTSTNSLTESR